MHNVRTLDLQRPTKIGSSWEGKLFHGRRQTMVQLQIMIAALSVDSIHPRMSRAGLQHGGLGEGRATLVSGRRGNVVANVAMTQDSGEDPEPPVYQADFTGQKVFVAGATGKTGIQVVKRLVKEEVPVVAFVRNVQKAKDVLPEGVTIIQGDVTKFETIPTAITGCTAVVNASATNQFNNPLLPFQVEYQGTKNLIAAAQQAGVNKFVLVTVIGADEILSPFNLIGGLSFFKKLAEDEVQRAGFNYTIIRPGGLADRATEGREIGQIAAGKRGTYSLVNRASQPRGAILRSQVADLCVDSIVDDVASNLLMEVVTDPSLSARTSHQIFVDLQ